MPRKRNRFKPSAPITGIREEPRWMLPFESVVDCIHRRSFLNVITAEFFGMNIHEDPYDLYQYNFAHNGLEPHPRIRELVEEEADTHAQELIEEERKQKDKAEKNRRKKLRQKEKRLEKQTAVKALSPAEEGNSENREEDGFFQSDGGRNGPDESSGTRSPTQTADDEEGSQAKEEEENCVQTAEEDAEIKVLYRDPEPDPQQATVAKECSPLTGRNLEQDQDPTQTTVDPTAEEDEERSRELAGMGVLWAASGQYEMAVKYFTDAINCNPKEFKLFGNRSLCYERMQQYSKAYRDADRALSIEPRWIKGLFRKGKALCGLKRYYEASLIYRELMDLDSSSIEARQELIRAQTLHLTEMGFSWAESSKALETYTTMEEAIESLFKGGGDASAESTEQAAVQEEDGGSEREEEWTIQRHGRHRGRHTGESVKPSRLVSSPSPRSGNAVKPKLFSVWVGVLAPSVTYLRLHQLFSSVGTVYSIKMLLEHQCAFVNYTTEEDRGRAIHCLNGKVVEGAPLSVRYPSPSLCTDLCRSKECFFWRTIGCTRSDCIYKHNPNHRGIDRDKFSGGLGHFHT